MISDNFNMRILPDDLISLVQFSTDGLVPAIVQERKSGSVLMMAWMNKESLAKTIETGRTWFWSRSRKELWAKGETSGDRQKVLDMAIDCDGDTILIEVEQQGKGACHTGNFSCFYRGMTNGSETVE